MQLSCDCKNAWLAFWPQSFSEPLVSADVLRFLAARRRRRSLNGPRSPGYKFLHVINEEPACPYNCSLTVAELFHMPKRVVLRSDDDDSSEYGSSGFNGSASRNLTGFNSPFAHCLPRGESDARTYFAQKCSLSRLALDVEKVIKNETEHVSVTCSRYPLSESSKLAARSCPFLKLAPFMSSTYRNDSGNHGSNLDNNSTALDRRRQRWPLETKYAF